MRAWEKLEKYCRIDWQISTHAKAPESGKGPNCCKVWRTGCDRSEYSSDTQSRIECMSPTENIAPKAPEDGSS